MVIAAPPPAVAPVDVATVAVVRSSSAPHGWTTYRVRPGDTLGAIAARHHTSVGTLVARNHVRHPGLIYPGDRLHVPRTSSAPRTTHTAKATSRTTRTTHVVRSGETVSHIAARYGVSSGSVLKANRLSATSLIYPGDRLVVRAARVASTPKATHSSRSARAKKAASGTRSRTYTVRSGDTLSGIAARYGTTAARIASASGIRTTSLLRIGQKVRVPRTASTPKVASSFAGVTYPRSVVGAARKNAHRLAKRSVPSRSQVRSMVVRTARRHGVDPALALAISYQESGWNQRAVSPANAVGVMQVIPVSGEWASSLVGRDLDLLDAQDNITAGVVMLRALGRSTSSTRTTVAAYYQGLASVRSRGMYSDTRQYVANVLALRKRM